MLRRLKCSAARPSGKPATAQTVDGRDVLPDPGGFRLIHGARAAAVSLEPASCEVLERIVSAVPIDGLARPRKSPLSLHG
jgi:hypothetical protein